MSPPSPSRTALAPYAMHDDNSRGRSHRESPVSDDCPFEMDRYRILNCMAFRRLMHKTQVFISDQGDHFRTRLTHTVEVAAQARRIARRLQLNERLAEAAALAHDLGHPPFGHAGEEALAALMAERGGFEHNRQSLRVVDYLEHPYPEFRGLNLSFEVLESLVKHETRYDHPEAPATKGGRHDAYLEVGPRAPLEGQAVNLADVIAYTLHDIEDGLVENVLTEAALAKSRIWREASDPIHKAHPDKPIRALRRPIIDVIGVRLLDDVVATCIERVSAEDIKTVEEVRHHAADLLGFSEETTASLEELQAIMFEAVYRNHRVVRMDAKARRLIRELFEAYLAEPRLMPERFTARVSRQGLHRVVCDYVAGMTDRFCQQEHRRLFAPFHFE